MIRKATVPRALTMCKSKRVAHHVAEALKDMRVETLCFDKGTSEQDIGDALEGSELALMVIDDAFALLEGSEEIVDHLLRRDEIKVLGIAKDRSALEEEFSSSLGKRGSFDFYLQKPLDPLLLRYSLSFLLERQTMS